MLGFDECDEDRFEDHLVEHVYEDDQKLKEDIYKYRTVSPGDGKNYPEEGDTVKFHYRGKFKDSNEQFDSSFEKEEPLEA